MKKFSKIRRIGHNRNTDVIRNADDQLLFKEKLDGANFRFTVIEHEGEPKFLFGSKNIEYKINGEPDYEENVDNRFKDAIEWVRENCDPENFNTDFTFFCENMVKHSLEYNWDNTPQVIGFDVYDEKDEEYLGSEQAYTAFKTAGIPIAPKVDEMTVEEFDPENYEIPESNFRDGKMEGVVIINQDQEEDQRSGFNTRAKMVTDEFLEKHKKSTGARQSKEAIKGHEKIVSKYCTDGRIRKHIQKMRDEGRKLGMELMGNKDDSAGLPVRVSVDIVEEEADEIVRRNDEMNWKNYRSAVADRCVHVLRQQMQRQAGGQTQ